MDSARCSGPYEKIPPAPGTNRIADLLNSAPSRAEKRIILLFLHTTFEKKMWVLIIAAKKIYSTL